MRDWVLCERPSQTPIGIVAPDVYALDGSPEQLRFTLLRSPIQTHHDPDTGNVPRPVIADQGEHHFVFRFVADAAKPDLSGTAGRNVPASRC